MWALWIRVVSCGYFGLGGGGFIELQNSYISSEGRSLVEKIA